VTFGSGGGSEWAQGSFNLAPTAGAKTRGPHVRARRNGAARAGHTWRTGVLVVSWRKRPRPPRPWERRAGAGCVSAARAQGFWRVGLAPRGEAVGLRRKSRRSSAGLGKPCRGRGWDWRGTAIWAVFFRVLVSLAARPCSWRSPEFTKQPPRGTPRFRPHAVPSTGPSDVVSKG